MIKKLDIAGLQLDNYTVREAIRYVEASIEDRGFFLIEEVTLEMVLLSERQPDIRQTIAAVDLTVIADSEILAAVGANHMQRQHEIDEHDFFHELLKRCERNHKSVFLLAQEESDIQKFKDAIAPMHPRVEFVGEAALAMFTDGSDGVVNEINAVSPNVIISILPPPQQEVFLQENRAKLSTGLWYGVGGIKLWGKKKSRIRRFYTHWSRTRLLKKHINQYQKQNED